MSSSGRQTSELQCASSVSFSGSKSSDYIRGLQRDLDRLLDEEFGLPSPSSRSYGGKVGKDPIPNRECFLFTRQILPTNKAKQQLQAAAPPQRDSPPKPPSSARPRFYRPNSSHQYLTATEVSDCSLIEATHGRPTRTTLLRAHQRVSSAPPVNAYEERRIQKLSEEERAVKRPISSAGSVSDSVHQEMVVKKVDLEGDTVHQFMIGARYNSAHYVDKKAIEKYGVYMSRHHPGQLFIKNDSGKPQSPRSRPSSPVEAWNSSSSRPATASTTMAPASPPRPSTPTGQGDSGIELEDYTPSPPLTVRGSRIAPSGPTPSPRDNGCARRPPTPSFGGMPARRVKSSGERRTATPLPQVVGLSLQISPGAPPHLEPAPALPARPAARSEALVRARRVLASSRLGNRFTPPTTRRPGVPPSDVTRAFSVRPWRDPKTLRNIIRQSAAAAAAAAAQKAEADPPTRTAAAATEANSARVVAKEVEVEVEAEEEEAEVEASPITIQVELRSTESGRSSSVPGVVVEDLEETDKRAERPAAEP